MYYVYILQSQKNKSYYTGFSENLKNQLENHSHGKQKYTSQNIPYTLSWYCAFKNKKQALVFEKYLKSGSGFAFARKRLVS